MFRAVLLNGTTQAAAEVLHVSQPGVSKSLQELERQLGFALFHRSRKRLVPTAEARLWFREVEGAFEALSRLDSAAARIRDFGSGQIRIATLSALSTNVVPRALRRFRDRHPDVSVTLQARMSATVRELVHSGGFDIGLAADEIDVTGLDAQPFARFEAEIALPAGHPLAARAVLTPALLDGCDFVALSAEDTTRRQFDAEMAAAGAAPRIVLETPFAHTVCALVEAGLGCGLVNPLAAGPWAGRGVVLRPFRPAVQFRTLLLRPAGEPASRIVAECIAALRAEVAGLSPEASP